MKFLAILLFSISAMAGLPPTASKINGESNFSTTFKTDYGTFTGTRSGTSLTLNGIGDGSGTSLVLGGTKNANAILDVQSTTKAFLPPRMTDAQMKAIPSPVTGMVVYNTDYSAIATYNGTIWTFGFANLNLDNVYSARLEATTRAVTTENKDFIQGNCTASAVSVCTFVANTFTVPPVCTATAGGSNRTVMINGTTTTSTVAFYSMTLAQVDVTDTPLHVMCQKQGEDYLSSSSSVYSQASADFSGRNDGVITIGATTTAPTKGTTAVDRIISSRYGNRLVATYNYRQSAGGAAGSGDYLFSLPTGISFDTGEITPYSGALFSATDPSHTAASVGTAVASVSGQQVVGRLIAYDSTRFRVAIIGGSSQGGAAQSWVIGSSNFNLAEANFIGYGFNLDAPISGWSNARMIVGSFAQLAPTRQVFTSGSGTYTTPSSVAYIKVRMVGGGGNGGASSAGTASGGGGAGGYVEKTISAPLSSYSYSVGGVSTASTFSGGAISLSAGGGSVGCSPAGGAGCVSGAGGTASGGDLNINGQLGGSSGGVSGGMFNPGPGASSLLGGGGAMGGNNIGTGQNASGYGAGGGGGGNGGPGGSATTGYIEITEYYKVGTN